MRIVDVSKIENAVRELSIETNRFLGEDIKSALEQSLDKEETETGREVIGQIIENSRIAGEEGIPICQDTGFAIVFLEIGQDVRLSGDNLKDAVNRGISRGYREGYMRKSILRDPLTNPVNTGDNTPAVIHTEIVPGETVKVTLMPKGGGAENMSRLGMLKPSDGLEGIRSFVVETVELAGANACPPVIVGVGIGGTFDYVTLLSKKALLRKIGQRNEDPGIAKLEREWLKEVNSLGIGPGGFGGRITALELFIEVFPRHIATLPVAVNIQCNAARAGTKII